MKKWVILILVFLGGLLLVLQYFAGKREKSVIVPSGSAQTEPLGVALPPSSTEYAATDMAPMPEYAGGASDYSRLNLPQVQSNYKGACQGGSLEEMRQTHGRYWGYFAKDTPFNFNETQKMYDLMAGYTGCVAAARQSISLCEALPGELPAGEIKVDISFTPRYKCREQVFNALFGAYMAGKVKDPVFCQGAVSFWKPENAAMISVPDFCKAAADGMDSAYSFLARYMPPSYKSQGKKFMPTSKSSCGGDAACLAIFQTYNAIQNGDAAACPRSDGYCEAIITRAPASCENIVREMSGNYCSYMTRVKKVAGGYIGMSPEAIKADIAQQALLKKEADQQKKDNEKIQAELNKQVKKMLGKQ